MCDRFESYISDDVRPHLTMQALSVVPAEIIKMPALVICITVWQKCNDELTINRSNAGNRTEKGGLLCVNFVKT